MSEDETILPEDRDLIAEVTGAIYTLLFKRLGEEGGQMILRSRSWLAYSALVNVMAMLMVERFLNEPEDTRGEKMKEASLHTAWAIYSTVATNLELRGQEPPARFH